MPHRRLTFSKFIIEDSRRRTVVDAELTGLLNDVQTACKFIASAVSRGGLESAASAKTVAVANEIMTRECEWGGTLRAILSSEREEPSATSSAFPRGRYLLVFKPLDGSANLDVNQTAGTIFSILQAPAGAGDASSADFLQPGTQQLAAGFALYGPTSIIVLTLGAGVHGFTLDREIGAYTLTHPDMKIAGETSEFAIDASSEPMWEPPIRHYVEECIEGATGPRGATFTMRWVDSLVAQVHRVLVRGGVLVYPLKVAGPSKYGWLHLLHEANPMAMIVEEAGGAASTGRARLLDIVPATLSERVPAIFGSRSEVERLLSYHKSHDRGEQLAFETPLFKERSLFRAVS